MVRCIIVRKRLDIAWICDLTQILDGNTCNLFESIANFMRSIGSFSHTFL